MTRKRRTLTRRDMLRLWPTNVWLWSFLLMERWRLAKP
jgi:hypothetical protein